MKTNIPGKCLLDSAREVLISLHVKGYFFYFHFICLYVQACMFVWRSKVNVGCLPQLFSTLFFEIGSLLPIF